MGCRRPMSTVFPLPFQPVFFCHNAQVPVLTTILGSLLLFNTSVREAPPSARYFTSAPALLASTGAYHYQRYSHECSAEATNRHPSCLDKTALFGPRRQLPQNDSRFLRPVREDVPRTTCSRPHPHRCYFAGMAVLIG